MILPAQLNSPYLRPMGSRTYESDAERTAHHELSYLRFWPYSDYQSSEPVALDLAPSLAGNAHCRNDMGLRDGLLRLMALWLSYPSQVEGAVVATRRRHLALGDGALRCACGRPHWLDPSQHATTLALLHRVFGLLDHLGVRSIDGSTGQYGWSLALPPSLGLPPRVVGYWDHAVRQHWSLQQMLHVAVTRSVPCSAPASQPTPTFRVPLSLALAVSAIAARHGGKEATIAVLHLDADTGEAHGALSYVPVVETARVGIELAERWRVYRERGTAAAA
jgi:hypothetical protein